MKKKVLMRKNAKKMNAIQLLAKRLNHTLQIPENLEEYCLKDIEVAGKELLKKFDNNGNEVGSKVAANSENFCSSSVLSSLK